MKKTLVPDKLTAEEKLEVYRWVHSKAYPLKGRPDPFYVQLVKHKKLIGYFVDACLLNWKDTTVRRPGWTATCKKWIATSAGYAEEKRINDKPKMQEKRGSHGSPLQDVLEMFEKEVI